MNWITRERPKIDRIACPWLIKRFIDPEAIFHFVPFELVKSGAKQLDAIPFDIPEVEYTHYKDECTFDYFVQKHNIEDPAVRTIAKIVRAADTDRHDMAGQASGLWAISAGLSFNIKDDHKLLEIGMVIYDGLYSWAKHLQNERHTQNPTEGLLIEVYRKFLKQKASSQKIPSWVKELKEIIQDQIDTDLSLSLQDVSKSLQVHPAYISREFSKYFDDLSFGEYLRKLRIERAIKLLETTQYTLAEIAYLTGFSDQSHFTRIFKKHTGLPPSIYKKQIIKASKK
ncbi:chromate resistance protein [Fulvivirgaceae bacterium BMA10]|uniref:Chromate resistance protein n=1 Tax=Splendidivirga corallicola TaxID=3051826 RepID=A0ABT8KNV6_9BACT|nr:chromate resistance protein [Fulvivirgaceae bacterium BMA10]